MIWQPLAALALAVAPVAAPSADVQEVRVVPAGGDTEIVVTAESHGDPAAANSAIVQATVER